MRCMEKDIRMLTPRQYAERHQVAYTTVMNWLRQDKIPSAVKHSTPTGHYWQIPLKASKPKLQPGRPTKAKPTQSNGKKRGKK